MDMYKRTHNTKTRMTFTTSVLPCVVLLLTCFGCVSGLPSYQTPPQPPPPMPMIATPPPPPSPHRDNSMPSPAAPPKEFHHMLPPKDMLHYFDTDVRENVPEYVIISPRHIRGSRRRRDVTSPKEKVEYHVAAFGEDYWLDLHHNDQLIGQGCILQHRSNDNHIVIPCAQTSSMKKPNDDVDDNDDEDCYYTGVSRHHTNSTVAVSLCSGLNGVISTQSGDHDLVIQPIKSQHVSRVTTCGHNGENAHVVYKRKKTGTGCHGSDSLEDDDLLTGLQWNKHPKSTGPLSPSEGIANRREKRDAGNGDDLYMELLLVADASMYKTHGSDLKTYMLTIANVAAARFLDASLGRRIHLRVVKMVILETEVSGLEVVDEASYTLKSFCQWQEQDNPSQDSNPGHYDGAALITKLDLTHGNNGQSTTGFATRSGMCGQYTRCSVSQDTGIDTGLTMAHEIGHTLGMGHDSSGNTCPNHRNMMSSHGARGVEGFRWSSCSRDALTNFLSSDKADCLKDRPSQFESLPKDLPGVLYSGDQQCEMWLGRGSTMFEDNSRTDMCGSLMCTDVTNPARGLESSMPVMDGTMCGQRKYCIQGRCQDIGPNGPKPVDGGWSAWPAAWSVCSRTCNGGVRTKTRLCHNPRPRLGGKSCEGEKTKTELCNIQPCSDPEHKFKENQCRATSGQSSGSRTYDWLPFDVKGVQECHLMCISRPNNRIQRRVLNGSRDYKDGTSCLGDQRMDFYRCVQGVCEAISCDGHSDSDFRFDRCGICGGRGDSCDKKHGSKTRGQTQRWSGITKLPKGSTGVKLINKNRFAKMTLSVNGQPLFNTRAGGSDPSSTYSGSGVTVKYGQGSRNSDETLEVTGPLPVDVDAEVFTLYDDARFQPDISYEFYVPTTSEQTHEWRTKDGPCTVTCGGGVKILEPSCHRKRDGAVVEDRYCVIFSKPSQDGGACNTQPCTARWKAEAWSSCSKSCGGGVQTRSLQCVQTAGGHDTTVDSGNCQANRRPSTNRDCNIMACGAQWSSSDWSSCSLTCGKGTQTREVKCVSGGQEVTTSNCKASKPESRQSCVLAVCDTSLHGDACKDVEDACKNYDVTVCKDYGDWAKTNCMETCSYCTKQAVSTASTSCVDTLPNCQAYDDNTCTQYKEWAAANCAKRCGSCGARAALPKTTTIPTTTTTTAATVQPQASSSCVDTLAGCQAYEDSVCTQFKEWAAANCAKRCGSCGATTKRTTPPTTTTTTQSSASSSSSCVDKSSDCSGYGQDLCTGQYKEWATINCAKFCNFCGAGSQSSSSITSCHDKIDCSQYDTNVCTDYVDWSKGNCAKTCGLCNNKRRRRSVFNPSPKKVCGHVLTSSSGTIDVVGQLDRDTCSQIIVAPLGHVINITLDAMLVDCEAGESLRFIDMLDASSGLDLCQDVDAFTWMSSSNNVEVLLSVSDDTHGYKLDYQAVPGQAPVPDCSHQLTDPSGQIEDPFYQDSQNNIIGGSLHCETVITAPRGFRVQILMSHLNEDGRKGMEIYDVMEGRFSPVSVTIGQEWTSSDNTVKFVYRIIRGEEPIKQERYKGHYSFVLPW